MSLRPPIPTIAALSLAVLTAAAAAAQGVSSLQSGTLPAPGVSPQARALERRPGASGQITSGSGEQATATSSLAARARPDLTSENRPSPLSVAPVVVQVTTPQAGFDRGDAGIGAERGREARSIAAVLPPPITPLDKHADTQALHHTNTQ
jgi:hypothetical protein